MTYSLAAVPALATAWLWLQFAAGAPDPAGPRIIAYDAARCPNLQCVAGRVVAETDPALSPAARAALWREYGLEVTFEWVVPESGFTYHELQVRPPGPLGLLRLWALGEPLPPRDLPPLIAAMNDDPRLNWACPDALLLEWCDEITLPPGEELVIAPDRAAQSVRMPAEYEPVDGPARGVSLLAPPNNIFKGTVEEWVQLENAPDPFPDFEYYRECSPEGTAVNWADELRASGEFMARCGIVYGTGQAAALADYRAAGAPELAPVTVCVADTGVLLNHPELAQRLHPNAIDANYTGYEIAAAGQRAGADTELANRRDPAAIGLPRPAVKGRPASHGTNVSGILARCTAGFGTPGGDVRLLPVSVKSDKTIAIVGFKIKTPISSAIKMINCLSENFPVGEFHPAPDDPVQNTGDVRVVSMSASVPRSYFSDAEWKIVSGIVGKAAGSIAEDLRQNDRVYIFASGNEAQGEPSRPGNEDFVIAAAATMPYDGAEAWHSPGYEEGANMGGKCVSAPGHAIITSTIYPHPNLAYLDNGEFRGKYENFSTPRRDHDWLEQSNHFAATSSATPQVAALAALLYAQAPGRDYRTVIGLIEASTAGRRVTADWGEARGLIDYRQALNWQAGTP